MKTKKTSFATRAWIIWLLGSLFMFYKYALEVSPSVMTSTLMQTFNISGASLGNLAACYFYAYLLLQIPAGFLLDRLGPRKVATGAIVLCAGGGLLFAQAPNLFLAGTGRFLIGAGAAFAAVNSLKLISNWFPFRQFAFMTGLMMTLAMLGSVAGQAPLAAYIQALPWREALSWIAMSGFILALIFWLVVRDTAPNSSFEHHIVSPKLSLAKSLQQVLANKQSWWLSIYSGFAFAPVMVFGGLWGVPFLKGAYHLSNNMAAQIVSLIFIGFAVGAPTLGWLSDRLEKRNIVMFWGTTLSLIVLCLVLYFPNLSFHTLMFSMFFFGFSISSFLLCFTMIREINLPILAGTAIGFMNAFDALFGAFSDPLTGWILDRRWDGLFADGARVFSVEAYQIALSTLPIYLVIALFSLSCIQETNCKPSFPTPLP